MDATTINAMELRQSIGDILNRVQYTGERFIVTRKGDPIAAIVSPETLEWLEQLEDRRDAEILRLARETSEGVVPFSELIAQFEKAHGERLELPDV